MAASIKPLAGTSPANVNVKWTVLWLMGGLFRVGLQIRGGEHDPHPVLPH
jgi:hypothetical protein